MCETSAKARQLAAQFNDGRQDITENACAGSNGCENSCAVVDILKKMRDVRMTTLQSPGSVTRPAVQVVA